MVLAFTMAVVMALVMVVLAVLAVMSMVVWIEISLRQVVVHLGGGLEGGRLGTPTTVKEAIVSLAMEVEVMITAVIIMITAVAVTIMVVAVVVVVMVMECMDGKILIHPTTLPSSMPTTQPRWFTPSRKKSRFSRRFSRIPIVCMWIQRRSR